LSIVLGHLDALDSGVGILDYFGFVLGSLGSEEGSLDFDFVVGSLGSEEGNSAAAAFGSIDNY
jgi:hypothetical protein